MASNIKSELTKAISDLAEGFTSLEEEFKILATQHDVLKKQLSEHRLALGKFSTEDTKPLDSHTSTTILVGEIATGRSVVDWISDLRGSTDSGAQKSIARIRDAEFGCFKIREKLKQREVNIDAGLVPLKRKDGRVSFNDIEQDHTIVRTPGELGCPFAKIGERKMGPPPPYARSHGMHTPRSSGSHVDMQRTRSRSHRPSLNDPIRPELEVPASEASEQGPACPIRFLDRHTPEDVAKYFEEHKHELPRSHEFCVKRFQTNSESIKELDAKYGNLVNMIQGLGQKHQPMLPEAPKSSDAAAATEDSKSLQRVKNWAKAVSEGRPEEDADSHVVEEHTAQSEGITDDRVSRFDRPLKEVRVGESPSRPWGVPIPSKYLDNIATSGVVNDVPTESAPFVSAVTKDISAHVKTGGQDATAARPKGKCPFGHGNATAPADSKPELEHMDQIPALQKAFAAKSPSAEDLNTGGSIINHGLAFVANSNHITHLRLENSGTLVIGYGNAEMQSIQREYVALHR